MCNCGGSRNVEHIVQMPDGTEVVKPHALAARRDAQQIPGAVATTRPKQSANAGQ